MRKILNDKQNNFANKMTDILNYGALNLAIALGYRSELFDVMDAFDSPKAISYIADKTGLNMRYIKEWLGIMVSGGVIEISHDETGLDCFYLPREHGDVICRRSGNSNMGVYSQEIPLLTTCAMESVYKGFKEGKGVSYDHYPRFQEFMAQLANAKHQQVLVNDFLPSVDNGRLIRKMKAGIRVCDLGCAEGVAAILMARAFPNSEFIGIDISQQAISKARSDCKQQGIKNLDFLRLDTSSLKGNHNLENSFDYITAFDVIHDLVQPLEALQGVYSILKADGLFSMIDIAASSNLEENKDHPMGPFLYTVSLMHCMPVGLLDGGTGLGMMWGRQKAIEMLEAAGFKHREVIEIPEDPFNLHFMCKKTD